MAFRFRYLPRFSLRALLLLPILVGGLLCLWRMPFCFTSPKLNPEGDYNRIVVRFGWDGRLYHHGSIARHTRDGQKISEFFEYGTHLKWHCINDYRKQGARFWDRTGREISCDEYFRYALQRQASR